MMLIWIWIVILNTFDLNGELFVCDMDECEAVVEVLSVVELALSGLEVGVA